MTDLERHVWLVISTIVLYTVLEAGMVGLSLSAISRRLAFRVSPMGAFFVLVPIFALLALYYVPAIAALDARLIIGNEAIAAEIGPGTPIVVRELFRVGVSDPVVWALQAVIGAAVNHWASRSVDGKHYPGSSSM